MRARLQRLFAWLALPLLALLLALPRPAVAQAVGDLALLVDAAGVESIDSVSAPAARGRFRPVRGDFRAGYTRDVHWLRFTVQAPAPGTWWLELQPAVLDDLRLFEPGAEGWTEHHTGDRQPFSSRDLDYRGFVVKLALADTAARTVYLRVQTSSSMRIKLALWRPDDFRAAKNVDTAVLGLYFGMAAMLLLFNLAIWAALREWLFACFSLHVASHALVYFGGRGLASQFLAPDMPMLGDFCTTAGEVLLLSSCGLLYQSMLRVGARPAWLRLPFRIQTLLPWLMLPAWFSGHYAEAAHLAMGWSLVFVSWVLGLSIWRWRQGQDVTRWIMLANAVTLIGTGLQALTLIGLPLHGLSLNTHLYSSVGTLLAMQVALASRIIVLRDSRAQAQRQAVDAERVAALLGESQDRLQALLTEKTTLLAERERQQALLSQTVDALHEAQHLGRIGSWEWDLATNTSTASPLIRQFFEMDPALPPPPFEERMSWGTPESQQRLAQASALARSDGTPYQIELEMVLPSGKRLWVEARGKALRDDQGSIVKLFGTSQDISDRRMTLLAEAARQAAALASRQKDEFLARVSHEMRTPLNALLGFAQLLALDERVRAAPELADPVNMIEGAAGLLTTMVDDVLDLAQIQSGGLRLNREIAEVGSLGADCLSQVATLAALHGITPRLHGRDGGHHVFGDRARLRQVVINLVSNAIKYNHAGGAVDISILRGVPAMDDATAPEIADPVDIVVSDTGPGLSAQQIGALFQPFNRLGAEASGVTGAGLGLALSRQLVEAMGGRLWARSSPGQGSVFTLRLPGAPLAALGKPRSGEASAAAVELDRPFVVLYVEDNRLNAAVMRQAMKRLAGVRLELATDGAAGLALARQLSPDLLLLDMNLPVLSGTEVMQQLRTDPALAAIPCVAISANAMGGDIERALAAGFADYVTKPFEIAHVVGLVENLRRQTAEAQTQASGQADLAAAL